jgi:hypothetical protein
LAGKTQSCSNVNASSRRPSNAAACCTTARPHNLATQVSQNPLTARGVAAPAVPGTRCR